mgnify:CR=1 FL=1
MKRRIFNCMAAAFFSLSAMLTSCDGNGMKGSKFVNGDVKHDPMNFSTTETVGIVYFADDRHVELFFPYAIDSDKTESTIRVSSELRIPGEYEKKGNTITVYFTLDNKQKEPALLMFEVKDDGKALVGKNGGVFVKTDNKL